MKIVFESQEEMDSFLKRTEPLQKIYPLPKSIKMEVEKPVIVIKGMRSGKEALSSMYGTQNRLKSELEKEFLLMQREVKNSYDLAYDNLNNGLHEYYHYWKGRAEAFRDCVSIIERVIERSENPC